MKKYILSLMMGLCVSVSSFAQSHSDRISVGVGALYQRGLDATISWEHETRYHNAWEYLMCIMRTRLSRVILEQLPYMGNWRSLQTMCGKRKEQLRKPPYWRKCRQ